MESLTLTDMQVTLVVLLAVFSGLAIVEKGVSAFKNIFLKGGSNMEKRIATIEDKLSRDYNRINDTEKQLQRVDADMAHMLKTLNALLMHEITGNGVDTLKKVKAELDVYLSSRSGKP